MMKAIIFDVEGTLIDCVPQSLQSWQDTLASFGFIVPTDVLQLYSGMDGDEMLQLILPAMDKAEREQIVKAKGRDYKKRFLRKVKSFEGVHELFQSLLVAGYRLGLATDCEGEELNHYLSLTKIKNFVSAIACGDDVKEGKPSAALVNLVLQKLSATAKDSIMVGDTPYDAEAARAAGIKALGLLTGGFSPDALKEAGCYAIASNIHDVGNILLNSPRSEMRFGDGQ